MGRGGQVVREDSAECRGGEPAMTTEPDTDTSRSNPMTETLESKVKAPPSVSDRLRQLANWLEENSVTAAEVVNCSVDGWGSLDAHLMQPAVVRICGRDGV